MKRLNENQFDNERKLMNTFSNSNGIHLDNFFQTFEIISMKFDLNE